MRDIKYLQNSKTTGRAFVPLITGDFEDFNHCVPIACANMLKYWRDQRGHNYISQDWELVYWKIRSYVRGLRFLGKQYGELNIRAYFAMKKFFQDELDLEDPRANYGLMIFNPYWLIQWLDGQQPVVIGLDSRVLGQSLGFHACLALGYRQVGYGYEIRISNGWDRSIDHWISYRDVIDGFYLSPVAMDMVYASLEYENIR